ncbi:MAG: hypothetical protein AAF799_13550 [Myxococcota bacterium]
MLASFLCAWCLGPVGTSTPVQTRWETVPACVDAVRVSPRVVALMGSAPGEPVRLSLGAVEHEEGWRVSLALERGDLSVTRTLEGRDCTTLTEAVALVVAVQLDAASVIEQVPVQTVRPPTERPREAPPAPEQRPAPPPTVSPRTSGPADAPVRPPTRRSRLRAHLGASIAAERGILPAAAASFEVSAGVAWPHARLEFGALSSVGPDAAAATLPSVGGRFRLFAGTLRACGILGERRFQLPLCSTVELGDLRAVGTGLSTPETIDALWIALGVGARPQWRLGPRLALGGLVDVVLPVQLHRFSTAEGGLVHAVAPVATRLGVALSLRLP